MIKRIVCLVLTLILSLSCCAALADDPQPIETIPYEELPPAIDGQHHYLLLCVDQWTGKPHNLGNTDGIVIVTLDTRAHRVMLTSIIRDALVERPDGVIGRINYIAKNYGPEALCKVISQHVGVKIEKYLLFDFSQIASIVDFLGGVDIEITSTESNYLQRYAIPKDSTTPRLRGAGTYHFNGHSAVIYMRIRKVGGGGDFMRTQRVRTVLSTLADQCREITLEEARALDVADGRACHGIGHGKSSVKWSRFLKEAELNVSFEEWCLRFGHADLLAQWDEERNGPLKPSDVSRCDSARVWWRGECGHSWQLSVRTRAFNDAGIAAGG